MKKLISVVLSVFITLGIGLNVNAAEKGMTSVISYSDLVKSANEVETIEKISETTEQTTKSITGTTELTTEKSTETTQQTTEELPTEQTTWDLTKGLTAGDNGNGLYSSAEISYTKYDTKSEKGLEIGKALQITKNNKPLGGSYVSFTPSVDGVFTVKLPIVEQTKAKSVYVCGQNYTANYPSDLSIGTKYSEYPILSYNVKAGVTYFVCTEDYNLCISYIGFSAGGNWGKDIPAKKAVLDVTIDGTTTSYSTLKDAFDVCNGKTATLTLKDDYIVDSQDGIEPTLTGSNTNVTMVSNGTIYSVVRDIIDSSNIKNLITVRDGATLTLGGGDTETAVDIDGGFTFNEEEETLSDFNGMGSIAKALIYVDGGNLYLNEKSTLCRNYVKYSTTDDSQKGYAAIYMNPNTNSYVCFNGGNITQNYGSGCVVANSGNKLEFRKADIDYNESMAANTWGDRRGAVTAEDGEALVFDENCDVQIRSNKAYYYGENGNMLNDPYTNDVYAKTDITLNGKLEIGEICLSDQSKKVTALPTLKHKNSITLVLGTHSSFDNTLGNINLYVQKTKAEYSEGFDPSFMIKVMNGNGVCCYVKVKPSEVSEDNGVVTTKFSTVYMDQMMFRENETYDPAEALYGIAVFGGFPNAENYANEKEKYDKIGFEFIASSSKPENNTEGTYVFSNYAFREGVYASYDKNYSVKAYEYVNNCDININGDVDNFGWNTAFFGAEVQSIPVNTDLWVRKVFIDTAGNREVRGSGEWIKISTPSAYSTSRAVVY